MVAREEWPELARRVREQRDRRMWSQRDLAERAGVSPSTITRVEAGGGAWRRTVRRLADALGVDPADLAGTG